MENEIKLEQIITVSGKKAVICQIYDLSNIEVVYYDNKNEFINEDAIWQNGKWEFKSPNPCGGYAKNNPRLSRYVNILKDSLLINN